MAPRHPNRPQYRTLLLVGEGETEQAFLQHVKALYVQRGSGLRVTVRCAHGKGAGHVVDYAIRQRIHQFDQVAVLLDTDDGWSAAVQKRAQEKRIHVLKSEPCIEAMLLRAIGQSANGSAKDLKARLAPFVLGDALDPRHYGAHFGADALQVGRKIEPTLDDLLRLLAA
ncbi:MAG: RloB domain-containing protein [Thiomonas arsenitoxydans]|nr:RloB domain-containing protein [Thiomonas arsenitoxydans]